MNLGSKTNIVFWIATRLHPIFDSVSSRYCITYVFCGVFSILVLKWCSWTSTYTLRLLQSSLQNTLRKAFHYKTSLGRHRLTRRPEKINVLPLHTLEECNSSILAWIGWMTGGVTFQMPPLSSLKKGSGLSVVIEEITVKDFSPLNKGSDDSIWNSLEINYYYFEWNQLCGKMTQ